MRTIKIAEDPRLPDGEYSFIDLYCMDKTCDCRKTIIQVYHKDECVASLDYGWGSRFYYAKWMRTTTDDPWVDKMVGLNINPTVKLRVDEEGILILMNHLLDENWVKILKRHYSLVRKKLKKGKV